MRYPRRTILAGACACILCIATIRAADNDNTDGLNGVVRAQSAKTLGKAKINVGLGVDFEQSSDYVQGPTWNLLRVQPDDSSVAGGARNAAKLVTSEVHLAFGLLDFCDLGVALPLYYDWSGFGPSATGLGDVEVATKFMLPPVSFTKTFYQAILISATIPTGMKGDGLFTRQLHFASDTGVNPTQDLYTVDYVTVKPMMIFTLDFGKRLPLKIHANLGGVFTQVNKENTILGALALDYAPSEFIDLFAEVAGESRWGNLSSGYNIRNDPLWVTPGIRATTPGGLTFSLSGDFSLSSKQVRYDWHQKGFTYSTGIQPDFGVRFTFGWTGFLTTQDRDHDGVPDNIDRCPDDSGPVANGGCPEPDPDKDGICDPWVSAKHLEAKYSAICKGVDKCPTKPEDVDGFQDVDGCPDLDNDGDGIADAKDQCPDEPEDFDGFQDYDGCPDFDNDNDGIPDSVDKCPNEPEDLDGFQDNDGCPDLDNDNDGIPDLKDRCPDVPGPASNNGCPDTAAPPKPVKKEPDFPKQQALRGVTFENNTSELTFESFQWLDLLVKSLKESPDVEIEIRCYTDGAGKRTVPMRLTQVRAEAVRQYLVGQGVERGRIRAVGYGAAYPVADNRTAAGRALNRRIEIVRTK